MGSPVCDVINLVAFSVRHQSKLLDFWDPRPSENTFSCILLPLSWAGLLEKVVILIRVISNSTLHFSFLVPCHYKFVLIYSVRVTHQVKIHYYGNISFIRRAYPDFCNKSHIIQKSSVIKMVNKINGVIPYIYKIISVLNSPRINFSIPSYFQWIMWAITEEQKSHKTFWAFFGVPRLVTML